MVKQKYEISIWEDVADSIHLWSEDNNMQESKATSYIKEEKIAIIGSNTMTSPARAFEPKLVKNINGTCTFTFKMYYKYTEQIVSRLRKQESTSSVQTDYIDVETFTNPFMVYLTNERKIKVKWEGQWYDFVIKNCQEDSANKCITYTCKDLFINELSKNGFNIEIDDELENSMGTVEQLAERILENSDWSIGEVDLIQEVAEGPVYKVNVLYPFVATIDQIPLEYDGKTPYTEGQTLNIAAGTTIYVYYNCVEGQDRFVQFFYHPDGTYKREGSSQLVINALQCSVNILNWITSDEGTRSAYYVSKDVTVSKAILQIPASQGISPDYRGERLVRKQLGLKDPITDKYVNLYEAVNNPKSGEVGYGIVKKGDQIYKYIESEAVDIDVCTNYLTNASNFVTNKGWISSANYTIQTYPMIETGVVWDDKVANYIKFNNDNPSSKTWVFNTGLSGSMGSEGFIEGEKYIFRCRVTTQPPAHSNSTPFLPDKSVIRSCIVPYISTYKTDAGTTYPQTDWTLDKVGLEREYFNLVRDNSGIKIDTVDIADDKKVVYDCWYEWTFECTRSITKSEAYSKHLGFFLELKKPSNIADLWFREFQLFPLKYMTIHENDNDGTKKVVRMDPDTIDIYGGLQVYHKYYDRTQTASSSNIKYIYSGTDDLTLPSYLKPVYTENFAAVHTISGKESNRFNLLQTIAESFKCWCRFRIEHNQDTGEIIRFKYNKAGNPTKYIGPQKFVDFKKEVGVDTGLGFIYGIDLKSIQRTIQSDQLVTKTIVKPNSNQFGKDGFCTIQRASENYSKESFILNFDYYISQGMLDEEQLNQDLYNPTDGYYTKLREYNAEIDRLTDLITAKKTELTKREALAIFEQEKLMAEEEAKLGVEADILSDIGIKPGSGEGSFVDMVTGALATFEDPTTPGQVETTNPQTVSLLSSSDIMPLVWVPNADPLDLDSNNHHSEAAPSGAVRVNVNNITHVKTKNDLVRYSAITSRLMASGPYVELIEDSLEGLKKFIENKEKERDRCIRLVNSLHNKFFKKYSRFIQEGSWIDENYYDDNLYYLAAQSVAYTSSRPQISYNISVLRLSALEEFQNKKFNVGDIAFIQDTEFFGYTMIDGIKTPYKEKVLVSEITSNFDEPDKDNIKIQNYKTQFEDLFQRVAATTQQLKFAEGSYARAADSVNNDGTFNQEMLQNTVNEGAGITYTYLNGNIDVDSTGITLADDESPGNIVKLMPQGIKLSVTYGTTWETAITAEGINTNKLTAGFINARNIIIGDAEHPAFRWDENGINAYYQDGLGAYTQSKFVRFDKHGIYGVDIIGQGKEYKPVTEENIWYDKKAKFGMTWKGFFLRNSQGNGWVEISTEEDIRVMADKDQERIKIGRIATIGSSFRYGMRIKDADGQVSLETDDRGQLYLRSGLLISDDQNSLSIQENREGSYNVAIGYLSNISKDYYKPYIYEDTGKSVNQIFNANDKFIVYENGRVQAIEGSFKGDIWATNGSFSGHVDARTGSIGGWIIGDKLETGEVLPNLHSIQKIDGKPVTTLYGDSGLIDTQRINIGREARIVDYIKLGGSESPRVYEPDAAYIFNPDYEDDPYKIRIGKRDRLFLKAGRVSLTADGKMWLGENTESQILLDGTQSIIQGGGAMENGDGGLLNFKITPNWSIFKNIEVWGKIVTAVFEANHVQAVGGAMIFKPSYKVESFNNKTLTLDEDFIGSIGDFIILIDKEGNQLSPTSNQLHNQENYEELSSESIDTDIFQVVAVSGKTIAIQPEYRGNTEVDMVVNFGEDGSMIIGANSNWGGKDFLRSRGITLSEFKMISSGGLEVLDEETGKSIPLQIYSPELEQVGLIFDVNDERVPTKNKIIDLELAEGREWGRDPKAFLGDMDSAGIAFNDTVPKGYGLYSNNVYLNGSLVTRIWTNKKIDEYGNPVDQSYAGISTSGANSAYAHKKIFASLAKQLEEADADESRIVFFAGAADTSAGSIQQAPFQVTANGSLYAQRALIEHGIVSNGKIVGSDIYAARIHGTYSNTNDDLNYGLSFVNIDKGIGFFKDYSDLVSDETGLDSVTARAMFSIGANGLKVYDNYFIQITQKERDKYPAISDVIMTAGAFQTQKLNGSYAVFANNKIYAQQSSFVGEILSSSTLGINIQMDSIQLGCIEDKGDIKATKDTVTITKNMVEFDIDTVQINNQVDFGKEGDKGMHYRPVYGGYDLYVY